MPPKRGRYIQIDFSDDFGNNVTNMEITANKLTFIVILIALLATVTAYLVKVNPPPSGSEISGSPDKPLVSSGRWPIFRADSGLNGIAVGSLTDKLSLSWSFKTKGEIRSSAVIGNGLVFFGSGDGHIYAIKQKTGQKVWAFQTKDAVEAPPCLINDMVVAGS
jgi:putative pyrroloquinoline-quinone-binding quinoprotein